MFLAALYRAEEAIAERLIRIVNGVLPWPWIDEEKALPWVEKRSGLQLADSQMAAIRLALMAKAQSNSRMPLAARILRIELTIVVLPTPGPPVITSAQL